MNSPMSFMPNTGQTSGKESHVGTKADLLIRLVKEGSHCWLDIDGLPRRTGALVLRLTGSRVPYDTLLRKTPSSLTM